MRNHKYVINVLSGEGIDDFEEALLDRQQWLKKKSVELLDRLSQEGFQIASAGFAAAEYDGSNDAQVSVENRGNKLRAVVAVGATVLFIEFGTGVFYPDDHPEMDKSPMSRGTYGKKHGAKPPWEYYGDPGTNGVIMLTRSGREIIKTYGNPANKPMYEAAKQIRERLPSLVREVFERD